jgi:UDP-N-acetylmuramate dehydrogenase
MSGTLQVGTAVARPGQTVWGKVEVPERYVGQIESPHLALVYGANDGSTILVGAGAHGDEYNAMEAVRQVAVALDPASLRGAVIFVPVLNLAAFRARTRRTPADDRDLDTCYPGDPAGSPTEVLAHLILIELIAKADYALDLHTASRGGSNLICADRGVRGLTIAYRAERVPIDILEAGETVRLRVPAQRTLSGVARWCCEQGWSGLDWAVGLPGTVGGATANNAGAHGTEMIDSIESVTVMGPDGIERTHAGDWLAARYRHTRLRSDDRDERPEATLVVEVILRLRRGKRAALLALANEHAAWRKVHQPRKPCAGSIFKNPPGTYAGLLIEQAGLKGLQIGGAQISTVHANFIINAGGAQGADVLALIRRAQASVREQTGIALETEVEFIGEW